LTRFAARRQMATRPAIADEGEQKGEETQAAAAAAFKAYVYKGRLAT